MARYSITDETRKTGSLTIRQQPDLYVVLEAYANSVGGSVPGVAVLFMWAGLEATVQKMGKLVEGEEWTRLFSEYKKRSQQIR
jgi:hypothetical protein